MISALYKQGQEEALSAFGLKHGTPKPPPSWAQEWQGSDVPRVGKRVKIPSMQQVKLTQSK